VFICHFTPKIVLSYISGHFTHERQLLHADRASASAVNV